MIRSGRASFRTWRVLAARQYLVKLTIARVGTEAEINAAVAKLAAAPGGGLIVLPDAYTLVHSDRAVYRAAPDSRDLFLSTGRQGRRPDVVRA
jgi:hypothetical protein